MRSSRMYINYILKGLAITSACIAIIGFTHRESSDNVCTDIVIRIDNQANNYFVDESDILRLMTVKGADVIIGTRYDKLNLKEIEKRVESEPFIKEVQIYRDLKGTMLVEAKLRRPFARVITSKGSRYVAFDGTFLPVTGKFNTRVLILSGSYFNNGIPDNLKDTETGLALYEMLQFITNDKFWNAQIAELRVTKKGEVILYPQVTKQYVEFGTPDNYHEKFKKLKVFYQKILPMKGWNTYERVNLKYKDQIIAE